MLVSFSFLRDVLSQPTKSLLGLGFEANPPMALKDENAPPMMMMDTDETSPFHIVSQNFAKIGLLTIDQFLQAPADINDRDGPYNYHDRTPTPPPAPKDKEDNNAKGLAAVDGNKVASITQLHQACQRTFGKTDILKYEFIEVDGPNSKSPYHLSSRY